MSYLDLREHSDYTKHIGPFTRNGILVDTSVLWEMLQGLIVTRIEKKEAIEFQKIVSFLDAIQIRNRWEKFLITPQILTETFNQFRNIYSKFGDYKERAAEIMPIIAPMVERGVSKAEVMKLVDEEMGGEKPIIEVGDISIFVAADDLVERSEKIAIITKDGRMIDKYRNNDRVMIMDYRYAWQNAV